MAKSYPQLWDLLEGRSLFKSNVAKEGQKYEYDDQRHLALITALLGDPPQTLLTHGDRTSLFYNKDGTSGNISPSTTRILT